MMKFSENTEKQIRQNSVRQSENSKGLNAFEKFICIMLVCFMLPISAFFSFMDLMALDSWGWSITSLILFIWFLPLLIVSNLPEKLRCSKHTFLLILLTIAWIMIFPILLPFVLGLIS